ncbi:unnamed protein product, partial [Symbiodinium sp. KB8]
AGSTAALRTVAQAPTWSESVSTARAAVAEASAVVAEKAPVWGAQLSQAKAAVAEVASTAASAAGRAAAEASAALEARGTAMEASATLPTPDGAHEIKASATHASSAPVKEPAPPAVKLEETAPDLVPPLLVPASNGGTAEPPQLVAAPLLVPMDP